MFDDREAGLSDLNSYITLKDSKMWEAEKNM